MVGYISSVGLPFPELGVLIAILVEVLGGLSIILGYKMKYGAFALVLFTLATTLFFHTSFLEAEVDMPIVRKNLAILGGLLYMSIYGAKSYSIDAKRNNMGM